MGVSHSLDEAHVSRISSALQHTSDAIHGINAKFDTVDEHWQQKGQFHKNLRTRVEGTLKSFQRLDSAMNERLEIALNVVREATVDLTHVMENMVNALEDFDIQREVRQMPKAVIPVMVPLVILMIELAIANAYLGILLTRLPDVGLTYSHYLLSNAAFILIGLMMSLLWLGAYRCLVAWRTRQKQRKQSQHEEEVVKWPSGPAEGEEVEEVDKWRGSIHTTVRQRSHHEAEGEDGPRQRSRRPSLEGRRPQEKEFQC